MATYRVKSIQFSDEGFIPRVYAQLTLSEAVEVLVRVSATSRLVHLEMMMEDAKGEI
jgi:hypothetical protein